MLTIPEYKSEVQVRSSSSVDPKEKNVNVIPKTKIKTNNPQLTLTIPEYR